MSFIINPFAFASGGVSDVTDDFNRADSTTTLNTASDGIHTWNAQVGTWGINTNRGYCPTLSGGIGVASVNYGSRDATLEVAFATVARPLGVVMGLEDSDDYLRVQARIIATVHRTEVHILTAGVPGAALITVDGVVWADGDVMKVVLGPGDFVEVFRNGSSMGSSSASQLSGVTGVEHGLFSGNTSARFDDLSITS